LQEGLRAIGDTEALKKIVSPRDDLSQRRQCELLGLNRSMLYYEPAEESQENLKLMRYMDEEYLDHPTKGVLGMVDYHTFFQRLLSPLPKLFRTFAAKRDLTFSEHRSLNGIL